MCNQLENLLSQNKQWALEKTKSQKDFFNELTKGQSPDFLWIGCSDSRVSPSEITNASSGKIFVHRNIANVVSLEDKSVASVLYYGIEALKIPNIIVCGHTHCGGIMAAMDDKEITFLEPWLIRLRKIYQQHKNFILQFEDAEKKAEEFAKISVREQIKNLLAFDFIAEKVEKQSLFLHGLIHHIAKGELEKVEN